MNERWELLTLQWFLFKTDIGVNNVLPYSFEAKVHILTILQNINICDSQYGDSFFIIIIFTAEKLCFIYSIQAFYDHFTNPDSCDYNSKYFSCIILLVKFEKRINLRHAAKPIQLQSCVTKSIVKGCPRYPMNLNLQNMR